MLPESLEAVVALSGWRPVFASASLQPPAAALDAVPDTEDVRRRTSIASSRRRGRTDEGIRLVRGWLGTRLCRGAVARRRTCLLQTRTRWSLRAIGTRSSPSCPAREHPTLESINRLTHEYELKDYLAADWALRPVELVRERGRTMLVVEYAGGEPLDRLIGEPMEIGRFLRLAVALSAALGRLHGRGLIHKDINPANVIVDSAAGHVWLTGFGIASRLPRERQAPEPPEIIAGTLGVHGAGADGADEPLRRCAQRSLCVGCDPLPNGHRRAAVCSHGSHGVGALPYRPPGRATRRTDSRRASSRLGGHHEAARQDPGGSISNRGRCGRRPATLPDGVSAGRQHRALCAGGARHS